MGSPTDHQSVVSTRAGIANDLSASRSNGPNPNSRRESPSSPLLGLKMVNQMSVTTVTEKNADEKKIPRSMAYRRSGRLRIKARTSAVAVITGTEIAQNSKVCSRDSQKL